MKKIGYIFLFLLFLVVVLIFTFTSPVDRTPYFETGYYKSSQLHIDSLRKVVCTKKGSLFAGFSKVSITPLLNQQEENIHEDKFTQLPLAGYGDRKGAPATGIHDSIFVKAAALKAGNELIVFVSADLLIIPPDLTDSVVVLLGGNKIPRDRLLFSATHTHSSLGGWGGGFIGKQFAGKENKQLKSWLASKIAKAIISAVDDLKPARTGTGSFNAGSLTRNRLIGEKGTKNDDFSFLFIEQTGYRKAVIGSFSAHATTLGAENMQISADYPGVWARRMEETSVDYALFFSGSMGSQSPVSKGEGFDRPKYLGDILASHLSRCMSQTILNDTAVISYISLDVPLPDFQFRLTTKRNLSKYLSSKMMPAPKNACLQALRLGNMIWITTPADFSGEYALQIKNMLKARGFESNISGFNGSYVGYIIPGRYFYLDKYEPKAMGWFGPNMGDYTMELIRQLTDIVTADQSSKANVNRDVF